MKILLDTTYLLPLIGISVKDIPDDLVVRLLKRGYKVYINEITFFELSAKGAKYISKGMLSCERVIRGLNALAYDGRIKRISLYDTDVLLTSFQIRKKIDDFIDCLIFSTAVNYSDIFLTEDQRIIKLFEEQAIVNETISLKPNIEILNFDQFTKKYGI